MQSSQDASGPTFACVLLSNAQKHERACVGAAACAEGNYVNCRFPSFRRQHLGRQGNVLDDGKVRLNATKTSFRLVFNQ